MNRLFPILAAIFLIGCGPSEQEQKIFSGKLEGKVISKVLGSDGETAHELKIQFSDGTQLTLFAGRGMWLEMGAAEE